MSISLSANGITFSDGSTQNTSTNSANTDHGTLISITSYGTNGSYTYTIPSNAASLMVKVQGAGGGSAGYCESGGAGGYAEKWITGITPGANVAVTVGGGGGGVGYYAAGGAGGSSSFGAYCSATGGYGSNSQYEHTGGSGGVGSGGDVNLYGGGGTGHANSHGYGGVGRGGASKYGSSFGTQHYYSTQVGTGAPGAGAAGGCTDGYGTTGRTGTSGLVIVYAYT